MSINFFTETIEVSRWAVYLAIFYIFIMQCALSAYIARLIKTIHMEHSKIIVEPNASTSPQKNENNYKPIHPCASTQIMQETADSSGANNPDYYRYSNFYLFTHILILFRTIKSIIRRLKKRVNQDRREPQQSYDAIFSRC